MALTLIPRPIKPGLLLALALLLSGCSQLVANRISNSSSYLVAAQPSVLAKLAPQQSQVCAADGICMVYWKIVPAAKPAEKLKFQMDLAINDTSSQFSLDLNRAQLPSRQGTVLLLHGYRGSKEWLAMNAMYFQFLGFTVLVPDLLGHGQSDGQLAYGVRDAAMLQQLLAEQALPGPLLIVANSMGALSAAHILARQHAVAGVMLQAPMRVFDQAIVAYASISSNWLTGLMSEQHLRDGAALALQQAGVSLAQTDLRQYQHYFTTPTLILASDKDPIAPYEHYAPWQTPQLMVHNISGRHHALMAVISQPEHELIQQWLQLIPQSLQ